METSSFGALFVLFMCFCCSFGLSFKGPAVSEKPVSEAFISWDDMKIEGHKARLSRDDSNGSRVIVVDKNGNGDSSTVEGAINMVPEWNTQRVKTYILPGIYREKVTVPVSKRYISFIGNESRVSDTIITWNNKASDKDYNGTEIGTYRSASVAIYSDYFCAKGITFENTVVAVPGGHGMQAVALRVSGDKAFFYKVRILGTQDTLLDETGSHYYYQCHIQGSVDFIFGRAKSLFQGCVIQSTATKGGAIAAHHRGFPNEDTGFSFISCTINGTGRILLGRAWGDYSRTVYSYCNFENIITPAGWSDWNHACRQKTVVFGEFECSGSGSNTTGRVPWMKRFSLEEVRPFLDLMFINGEQWLRL